MSQTSGAIAKLPRLPVIIRELECVGARTDRNIRLHLAEKLTSIGTEVSATASANISVNADVTAMKAAQVCLNKEQEILRTKVKINLFS